MLVDIGTIGTCLWLCSGQIQTAGVLIVPSLHACSQVVTGIGRHSAGGQPRILPAVVHSLKGSGLRFWSQPDNAGVIEVLLPGYKQSTLKQEAGV